MPQIKCRWTPFVERDARCVSAQNITLAQLDLSTTLPQWLSVSAAAWWRVVAPGSALATNAKRGARNVEVQRSAPVANATIIASRAAVVPAAGELTTAPIAGGQAGANAATSKPRARSAEVTRCAST